MPLKKKTIDIFRHFSEELDPQKLQYKFLTSLLDLQNVERGSIWIKDREHYVCIEAVGRQSESVKGIRISARHPSIVGWVIENGKFTIADPNRDPRHYSELEENLAVKSSLILCFPLFLKDNKVYGAVQIIDTTPEKNRIDLDKAHLSHIQDLVNIGSIALGNAILFNQQYREAQSLKDTLASLRNDISLVGQGAAFQESMERIRSYARTDYPVLITGESGTGKELVACTIHQLSTRSDKPFLVQNCSAIPESLLESELFGYAKGAFSGAVKDKIGLFEAADGGTVFLDEIGDMPVNLQARILRVIQNNEIKPLGTTRVRQVDIKIISATNKDIKIMVGRKEFRKDLYYRLSVLPLQLPPLRERRDDIPLLFNFFMRREAQKSQGAPKKTTAKAMQRLMQYPWPGNVRELENLVRYLLVVIQQEEIKDVDLPHHFQNPSGEFEDVYAVPESVRLEPESPRKNQGDFSFGQYSWDEVEDAYARYLLEKTGWNISKAAQRAGLTRSTFASRMKRLGIRRPEIFN